MHFTAKDHCPTMDHKETVGLKRQHPRTKMTKLVWSSNMSNACIDDFAVQFTEFMEFQENALVTQKKPSNKTPFFRQFFFALFSFDSKKMELICINS